MFLFRQVFTITCIKKGVEKMELYINFKDIHDGVGRLISIINKIEHIQVMFSTQTRK